MRIKLPTFRHFKATMEYHRTKDILYVKELLGHKNIKNTLVYTHLVNFESDDYTVKVATSQAVALPLRDHEIVYIPSEPTIVTRGRKSSRKFMYPPENAM